MKVMANRMDLGFQKHQAEYEEAALRVLRSGWYVLGNEVKSFEEEFSHFNKKGNNHLHSNTDKPADKVYCASLASGLDALWIGIKMLGIGPGDEVIVQGNTYIASVMGITLNGAKPIFVEPDIDHQISCENIKRAITPSTKAIMVVHLYGTVTDMRNVTKICKQHGLLLIEDCAQAHGAMWEGQKVGTFGDIGCFSFYPTKNIGAFGDAGAIVSHDEDLIEEIKAYRNYGSQKKYYNKYIGANSRMDEIQAALLRVRLKYVDEVNSGRSAIARRYSEGINNIKISLPVVKEKCFPVWHQYVVRCKDRDALKIYLEDNGIGSTIHYPIPPYKQEAYAYLQEDATKYPFSNMLADEVLSLPMYDGMSIDDLNYVIETINRF